MLWCPSDRMVSDWFSLLLICTSIETYTDSADDIWWLHKAQEWDIEKRYWLQLPTGTGVQKNSTAAISKTVTDQHQMEHLNKCRDWKKENVIRSSKAIIQMWWTTISVTITIAWWCENCITFTKFVDENFLNVLDWFIQLVKCTLMPFYLYSRLSWLTNYFCAVHTLNWNHVTELQSGD